MVFVNLKFFEGYLKFRKIKKVLEFVFSNEEVFILFLFFFYSKDLKMKLVVVMIFEEVLK